MYNLISDDKYTNICDNNSLGPETTIHISLGAL